MAKPARLGKYAVIGAGVKLGRDVSIWNHAYVGSGTTIGDGVSIGSLAHVDYDVPGAEQRFAKQRAQRDAEDRAVHVVAETIRNRLASYFVAGT